MPQLNPHPWFMIMMMLWTITLTMILTKMTKYKSTNMIIQNSMHKQHQSWTWPWQ
uniref:ATP synthase complex subunit 8 n=1 Tax=Dermophis mexicanus TaxID=118251 RepID=W5RHB5_DERME|nr:ATP synthase F0 subunit 8 [Dermophis mexicanus]